MTNRKSHTPFRLDDLERPIRKCGPDSVVSAQAQEKNSQNAKMAVNRAYFAIMQIFDRAGN